MRNCPTFFQNFIVIFLNHNMDIPQDFPVNYKHVTIPDLAMEAQKEVINRMCV